jgi:hypothetical protein
MAAAAGGGGGVVGATAMKTTSKRTTPNLWVYRLVTDSGAAPHISEGYLTLTLCKPVIRKGAQIGDYVLAFVAQGHKDIVGTGPDRFFKAAYLFRVGDKVSLKNYEAWCKVQAPGKIPVEPNFMGNCQYDANLRWRPGPHGPTEITRNLSGCFSLPSNFFAAWTMATPYTFTDADIDGIGLDREQVARVTQGQFKLPLTRPEQIATLDSLIEQFRRETNTNGKKRAGKHCKTRGGRRRKNLRNTRKRS